MRNMQIDCRAKIDINHEHVNFFIFSRIFNNIFNIFFMYYIIFCLY